MDFELCLWNDVIWRKFLFYAFEISEYFSLTNYITDDTYANYEYYVVNDQLLPYKIDGGDINQDNGIWGEYEVKYYECNYFTMSVILEIPDITKMIYPQYPENLSFYKNNKRWFHSDTHHKRWELQCNNEIIQELKNRKIILNP